MRVRLGLMERLGIGVASLLGLLLGPTIFLMSDINPPLWLLVLLTPGALIGAPVARLIDFRLGVLISAIVTGGAYGLALYAWYRLPKFLAHGIPKPARLRRWSLRHPGN